MVFIVFQKTLLLYALICSIHLYCALIFFHNISLLHCRIEEAKETHDFWQALVPQQHGGES